jgi:hypothetical protein
MEKNPNINIAKPLAMECCIFLFECATYIPLFVQKYTFEHKIKHKEIKNTLNGSLGMIHGLHRGKISVTIVVMNKMLSSTEICIVACQNEFFNHIFMQQKNKENK